MSAQLKCYDCKFFMTCPKWEHIDDPACSLFVRFTPEQRDPIVIGDLIEVIKLTINRK